MVPVAVLQAFGARPRVHGNGFIQLDLTDRIRLHVWGDPRIPRQAVSAQIHDHTFGFTSYVLRGVLENKLYWAFDDPTRQPSVYMAHRAVVTHDADTRLEPTGNSVWMHCYVSQFVGAGASYAMRPGDIHETVPHGASVSVIVKDGPSLAQGGQSPTVYVPVGVVPDNTFDRYATPPELLWQIIGDAIGPGASIADERLRDAIRFLLDEFGLEMWQTPRPDAFSHRIADAVHVLSSVLK